MKIVDVVFNIPLKKYFSYQIGNNIEIFPSQRVLVPFGKQKKIGWIIGVNNGEKSKQYKYKKIIKVYDKQPIFPKRTLDICKWLTDTHAVSLGQVFYYLSNNIALKYPSFSRFPNEAGSSFLNPETDFRSKELFIDDILKNISEKSSKVIVEFYNEMDKTEFFLKIVKSVLGSQIYIFAHLKDAKKFYEKINGIYPGKIIFLSGEQNKKQKTEKWFKIINSDNIIVIGTRTSVFAPLKSINLLVIDEPEDFAYKETRAPGYNARDVSFYISEKENVPLVLSTMQPDLFEINLIQNDMLKHFIIGKRDLPEVILIPIKKPIKKELFNEFSRHIMEKTLLENGRIVIVNNSVKWNDAIFTTLSKDYSGFSVCKIDKRTSLIDKKFRIFIGTQTIINYLQEILPDMVIIPNGDMFVLRETFQSEERFFMLIQSIRKNLLSNAKVLIQTYNSNLPVYQSLLKNDFNHFYDYELSIRKKLQFPPFSHIIRLDFSSKTSEDKIARFCETLEKSGQVYKDDFKIKQKNSILWKVKDVKSSLKIFEKTIKEKNIHKIKINIDPLN